MVHHQATTDSDQFTPENTHTPGTLLQQDELAMTREPGKKGLNSIS